MPNPFEVQVVNPLQALLTGQQGYATANKQMLEGQKQEIRQQAFQDYQSGNPQSAIARLLQINDTDGVAAIGTIEQRKQQNEYNQRDFAFKQAQAEREQKNADRSFGLQSQQFAENQDYSPDERARMASQYGIQQGSPEFKAYVLTGQLPAGNTTVAQQTEQRKMAAESLGIKPDNPAYSSFVLTGKMPREDQAPLTAGDKEAIRTADDAILANRAAIESLQRAKGYSKDAFSGPAAGSRGYATSFLGESSALGKSGIATENLNNEVMTNALGQLKTIFGGSPTEGERKILVELQASVNKPDSVRQAVLDRAIAAAQKRLEFNQQRADQLRGGSYYKPNNGGQVQQQPQKPQGDPLALARDAIQRGADPAAVRQRLQQNGIDASGL